MRGDVHVRFGGRAEETDAAKAAHRASARPHTYLRCWEGVVYFAFVIDVFSRMIVGWQLAAHMRTDLVLDALKMALGLRGPGADVELVHHSDRGSPSAPTEAAASSALEELAGKWGERYPPIIKLWRNAWAEFVPFLSYSPEIRRVIYSTNAIESIHARFRRAVRARGHFPNEQAAMKCLYLTIRSLDPTGRGRQRWSNRWKPALNAFAVTFEGRIETTINKIDNRTYTEDLTDPHAAGASPTREHMRHYGLRVLAATCHWLVEQRLHRRLDDRLGTGYWSGDASPAAPDGLCDACKRRAAWLVVGGVDDEDDDDHGAGSFLAERPVHLCGWCRLDPTDPIQTTTDLDDALARARRRSITWSWR